MDNEDRETLNPASLDAARKIVCCIAAKFSDVRARVGVGMLGRVTLDWYLQKVRCSWMIDPTDLPFPSLRIYEAKQLQHGKMQTRVIHDMHSALCGLQEIIENDN